MAAEPTPVEGGSGGSFNLRSLIALLDGQSDVVKNLIGKIDPEDMMKGGEMFKIQLEMGNYSILQEFSSGVTDNFKTPISKMIQKL